MSTTPRCPRRCAISAASPPWTFTATGPPPCPSGRGLNTKSRFCTNRWAKPAATMSQPAHHVTRHGAISPRVRRGGRRLSPHLGSTATLGCKPTTVLFLQTMSCGVGKRSASGRRHLRGGVMAQRLSSGGRRPCYRLLTWSDGFVLAESLSMGAMRPHRPRRRRSRKTPGARCSRKLQARVLRVHPSAFTARPPHKMGELG